MGERGAGPDLVLVVGQAPNTAELEETVLIGREKNAWVLIRVFVRSVVLVSLKNFTLLEIIDDRHVAVLLELVRLQLHHHDDHSLGDDLVLSEIDQRGGVSARRQDDFVAPVDRAIGRHCADTLAALVVQKLPDVASRSGDVLDALLLRRSGHLEKSFA